MKVGVWHEATELLSLCNASWVFKVENENECDALISNKVLGGMYSIQIIICEELRESSGSIYYMKRKHTDEENLDAICDIVRNVKAVHVFGDSHTIVTSKVNICRENWLGFNTSCPITMFRFGKEGLDLHECIKVMGNGHEKYPIREGEYVMYSYGEIDCRYLILKHCSYEQDEENLIGGHFKEIRTIETITKDLIQSYIEKIKENETKYKCKSMVYFIIPPTRTVRSDIKFTGEINERMAVYKYFTKEFYKAMMTAGIPVVSIYDKIIDKDGFFDSKYIEEGDIHLKLEYYHYVRDAIMETISKISAM